MLSDVHFTYDSSKPEILKGLNLEVRCGERIGLIGSTGSGKKHSRSFNGTAAPNIDVFLDGINLKALLILN